MISCIGGSRRFRDVDSFDVAATGLDVTLFDDDGRVGGGPETHFQCFMTRGGEEGGVG
jgi:hypothetical protein